ncbi:MAG: hypothetical protein IKM24_00340 [Clostridia bacterium]|nr:hypothetical protein [Clostridia bacterium]
MKNTPALKKTVPIALTVLLLVCTVFFAFRSTQSSAKINDIENYETVFRTVDELQFFIGDNNFYGTTSPKKDLNVLKKVQLDPVPIAESNDIDREYVCRIHINDTYTVYIAGDYSQLWLDDASTHELQYNDGFRNEQTNDGLPASAVYAVKNPHVLQDLFESNSRHLTA